MYLLSVFSGIDFRDILGYKIYVNFMLIFSKLFVIINFFFFFVLNNSIMKNKYVISNERFL